MGSNVLGTLTGMKLAVLIIGDDDEGRGGEWRGGEGRAKA